MARIEFRPEAEFDLDEAAAWYEGERPGLGHRFLQAAYGAVARIAERPLSFPRVLGDVRRALVDRFPYGVFFIHTGEGITILGVIHLHRHPDSWRGRAGQNEA